VPNVGISRKFKVLEFVKYTGSQYPETHLKVYYSKLAEFINDEKLLINYLYASLVGPALNWSIRLNDSKIMKIKPCANYCFFFLKKISSRVCQVYKSNIQIPILKCITVKWLKLFMMRNF